MDAPKDASAHADQQLKLGPRGLIWRVPGTSVIWRLFLAMGDACARFEARAAQLREEGDPRTADELIGAWEAEFGLPDACTGLAPTLDERRAAVWQKETSTGGQSRAYFLELAARLGFDATIEEFDPLTCEGDCDGTVSDEDWQFVWCVHVDADAAPRLECVLGRLKPAHTTVFFEYSGA